MIENVEPGTKVKVTKPEEPLTSTWRGMNHFYNDTSKSAPEMWFSKKDYEECGVHHLYKTSAYQNRYHD